jgi:hypothetical protein
MRLVIPAHRRLTTLERLLGRRRARRLRRRLGMAALGAGALLLRPRSLWVPVAVGTVLAVAGAALLAAVR